MSQPNELSHEELREGDLLAFLGGAASAALAAHIAGCPRCQHELVGLRQTDALLSATMLRAACPAPERLLLMKTRLLPGDEARLVADHAATCADCTAELALLANPPEPGLPGRLARAGVRLVRALLQPAASPALALRGAESGVRRLVFAAEGYQILVAVSPLAPRASRYQIEGQLLTPTGMQTGLVRLSGSAQEQRAADLDELGFFAFDTVPPGAYALDFELADAQVLAELLEVP